MNFENKIIGSIYTSQYVMSYIHSGGRLDGYKNQQKFKCWLKTLEGLTEEEQLYIYKFATCGKLELQQLAKKFLKEQE